MHAFLLMLFSKCARKTDMVAEIIIRKGNFKNLSYNSTGYIIHVILWLFQDDNTRRLVAVLFLFFIFTVIT